jgi:chromosome segregation ATPase
MSAIATQNSLREQLSDLEEERAGLIHQKKSIEQELAELVNEIRLCPRMEPQKYKRFITRQNDAKRQMATVEGALAAIKAKKQRLHDLLAAVGSDASTKAEKAHSLRLQIVLLRDKYIEFGSDNTRVSSMRLMATQFAQDLELLLSATKEAA